MTTDRIREDVISMADKVREMVALITEAFMENTLEKLAAAMKIEEKLNEAEKSLTTAILDSAKAPEADARAKKTLVALEEAVETLERMGDEIASLAERIEIKVSERLLFSDTGVEQFNETYGAMKNSVEMMCQFLRSPNPALRERVVDNGFHVKAFVERYRKEHADRLMRGLCTPMAANMYFDMLDFTGNLARHSSNIVKLF